VFLEHTPDTEDLGEAIIRAKPALIGFDRILARTEALAVQRPMRATVKKREIDQITGSWPISPPWMMKVCVRARAALCEDSLGANRY
jgi:hypothetical protein